MDVSRIVQGIHTTPTQTLTQPMQKTEGASFSDFFKDALNQVVSTDYVDKSTALGAIVGEVQDIHTATIAAQKAEIALNLTLQIRNKLVESYQEIMRMQI